MRPLFVHVLVLDKKKSYRINCMFTFAYVPSTAIFDHYFIKNGGMGTKPAWAVLGVQIKK